MFYYLKTYNSTLTDAFFSLCTGYKLECEDTCEEVVCLNDQLTQEEVLEEAKNVTTGEKNCERLMCPKPYYKNFDCLDVKTSQQLCFCPKGYKQTQVRI